jgi:hypothetical protein
MCIVLFTSILFCLHNDILIICNLNNLRASLCSLTEGSLLLDGEMKLLIYFLLLTYLFIFFCCLL